MSACLLVIPTHCRCCGRPLTFLEAHEYLDDDDTAPCEDCVTAWSRAMVDYMRGNGPLPEQP